MKCFIYWGSHGCDLETGHEGLHTCEDCAQFELDVPVPTSDSNELPGRVRYNFAEDDEPAEYGEWWDSSAFYMIPSWAK